MIVKIRRVAIGQLSVVERETTSLSQKKKATIIQPVRTFSFETFICSGTHISLYKDAIADLIPSNQLALNISFPGSCRSREGKAALAQYLKAIQALLTLTIEVCSSCSSVSVEGVSRAPSPLQVLFESLSKLARELDETKDVRALLRPFRYAYRLCGMEAYSRRI